MNWDIYGNNLRRGFCEVHPHVNQEYPCDLCYREEREHREAQNAERQHWEEMERRHHEEMHRDYAQGQEGEGI